MTRETAAAILGEAREITRRSLPSCHQPQVLALIGIGLAILELKDALSEDVPDPGPWVQAMLPGLDRGL
jgi:hypothetical protein